ncbi:hypothetical protein EVAR_45399_1 [Eumeta japonica]|uniref:Uncharacterized protein n=1 Tax=Eumeta variegata TaxID=151549 RepID=A0A4C1WPV4_EUMVA|nr:hypothetical protein EVAR_45399_1 [Eumeta japonica]
MQRQAITPPPNYVTASSELYYLKCVNCVAVCVRPEASEEGRRHSLPPRSIPPPSLSSPVPVGGRVGGSIAAVWPPTSPFLPPS